MAKRGKGRRQAAGSGKQGEASKTEGAASAASGNRRQAVQRALARAHEGCPAPCVRRRCCRDCAYSCPVMCRRLAEALGDCEPVLVCGNRAEASGILGEVEPDGICRNFRMRRDPPLRLPPPEPTEDGVCYIALTRGMFAMVDAEDYERVNRYKWCVSGSGNKTYACRNRGGGRMISMQRFILDVAEGMVIDHIDRNRMNNRRSNLRVCTQQQNTCNSCPRGGSSRFKGVSRIKGTDRWHASVSHKGINHHAGTFDDEVEAARARDRLALKIQGPYAYLNFPEAETAEAYKRKSVDAPKAKRKKAARRSPQATGPRHGRKTKKHAV